MSELDKAVDGAAGPLQVIKAQQRLFFKEHQEFPARIKVGLDVFLEIIETCQNERKFIRNESKGVIEITLYAPILVEADSTMNDDAIGTPYNPEPESEAEEES